MLTLRPFFWYGGSNVSWIELCVYSGTEKVHGAEYKVYISRVLDFGHIVCIYSSSVEYLNGLNIHSFRFDGK